MYSWSPSSSSLSSSSSSSSSSGETSTAWLASSCTFTLQGKGEEMKGGTIQVGQTYSSWLCMHQRVARDPATDVSKFETVGSLVRIACSNFSSCCTHCNSLCEAEGERHSQSWLALQPHDQLVLQASWHHRNWPTRLHNAGTTNHSVQQVPVEEQLAMCGTAAGGNRR